VTQLLYRLGGVLCECGQVGLDYRVNQAAVGIK